MKLLLQDIIHQMEEMAERKDLLIFPRLDKLLYLKIVTVLFPTSDFWHPVVTPSLIYMSQLLTKCAVTKEQEVAKGLFVCCLFLECTSRSRRFVPEMASFLLGVLHMAVPNKEAQGRVLKLLSAELHGSVLEKLDVPKSYSPLVCDNRKPVPLKLYTPKIVKVLEFGRKQGSSQQEQERQRLVHKHRRELKGAVREIRRDNQFLAKMQLTEVMQRDSERKRKVKQLFQSLAQQEGDWNALKRKKH
ncbi:hypothetical protein Chor_015472 [Crotalus horridus]